VDITIYPQDAARILVGSKVRVWAAGPDGQKVKADGTIAYISPLIRESTRTGLARAVITNDKGLWRPGLFVTAEIITAQNQAAVIVPNDAVQTVENQTVVFVAEDDKFEKRVVVLDQSSQTHSGVKSGLKPGERYIAKGAFVLKAELSKGTGEHEH
jgi:cobalt-zinc-cadmium efflux system membrane fusion protein